MEGTKPCHLPVTFEELETKLTHECGIIGIYGPKSKNITRDLFFSLYALQHRGQEGAGMAVVSKHDTLFHVIRGMGLVMQVFNEQNLETLEGHLGIGHVRYSTFGASSLTNAQPFVLQTTNGMLGVAHNGQITLANKFRKQLMERGVGLFTSNDTEIVAQLLAVPLPGTVSSDPQWVERISNFMKQVEGAYALTILTQEAVYGVRDRYGNRPLCLGEIINSDGTKSWVLASESCAISTIGGRLVRDVEPGEIVRIGEDGVSSFRGIPNPSPRAFCVFEYVYFARPDSILEGSLVHKMRHELGRQLAREQPCPDNIDVVVGVPDSSIPMAIGYALESGKNFTEGLIKNRYIARTFIQPNDVMRQKMVNLKYNPLEENLKGKNVLLVDDSLVRGTTIRQLVLLFKSAKVKSLHVRIASPPITHPCYMGIDMKSEKELVAANASVDEICKIIEADSLGYLSIEGLLAVCGEASKPEHKATKEGEEIESPWKKQKLQQEKNKGFCSACFTGDYPLDIEDIADTCQ
eukprot:TRINITY_DN370_c1_g1_i1.p1 TRINITY_DN370_c1_g1~~TRINITY_DN370_c1_g1_i1.p1  ORF type:complete len:530 (+),score=82.29 TRINITY_DN370_c1_g1_i1:29-1591(+)